MGQVGEQAQKRVIQRIFQQVAQRPDSFCNYLEGIIPEWGEGTKLIYRHYATLYFVFAVDSQESDLGILDLVQGELTKEYFLCHYVISGVCYSLVVDDLGIFDSTRESEWLHIPIELHLATVEVRNHLSDYIMGQ